MNSAVITNSLNNYNEVVFATLPVLFPLCNPKSLWCSLKQFKRIIIFHKKHWDGNIIVTTLNIGVFRRGVFNLIQEICRGSLQ